MTSGAKYLRLIKAKTRILSGLLGGGEGNRTLEGECKLRREAG